MFYFIEIIGDHYLQSNVIRIKIYLRAIFNFFDILFGLLNQILTLNIISLSKAKFEVFFSISHFSNTHLYKIPIQHKVSCVMQSLKVM